MIGGAGMERVILHVDMDSFFASCEQQANPALRGVPIAVSGDPKSRTVVAAASKEAKRFGVRSAMTIGEARRLCPGIQFVLGDPDKYVEVSRRVIAILESFTPDVEVTSIDEAFLDVTGWAENSARHQDGKVPGTIFLAQEIKRRICAAVGEWITSSIGIAPNKRLAKLASEFRKPDGLVFVYIDDSPVSHALAEALAAEVGDASAHERSRGPSEAAHRSIPLVALAATGREPCPLLAPYVAREASRSPPPAPPRAVHMVSRVELLASLKLRDLCGIGPRIEARLTGLGITTVGALATAPLNLLIEEFGSYGYELHDMALGQDTSLVEAEDAEPRSMGHSVTLPKDLRTLAEVRPVVEELSEKVASRLRHRGYRGTTIHVTVRCSDFTSRSEQTTLEQPTDDGLEISRTVMDLLGGWRLRLPVRLVGVSVSTLVSAQATQRSLFARDRRWRAAIAGMDMVNDRYGDWTVTRASLARSERVTRKVAAAFRATSHLKGR